MDTNIYEPPKSDISVAENRPGSIVKAVVIGTLVEIVGTLLVGIAIGIAYVVILGGQGTSPEEMKSALVQIDPLSGLGLLGTVLGTFVSVLAGYFCARIANRTSFKPAFILSGISFTLGLVSSYGSYTGGVLIAMQVISVCAVLLGAWLYIRKLRVTSY
jgi:hypothetical protein